MNTKKIELLEKEKYDLYDLVKLVKVLRGEDGCPWDREQTHKSIRDDLIEETYEVIEAIDTDNPELLCEELGDVMLQVAFHADIESDEGRFNIDDVADGICRKMIYRHPHVFADTQADTSEQVLKNWEILKSDEKQRMTVTDKLRSIPPQLPALMRATKVGKKASCFDFPDVPSITDKVYEELDELKAAIADNNNDNIYEEMGDLLLSITSLCRKLSINPERALGDATDKFIGRFEKVENEVISEGKNIGELGMDELDAIWDKIKQKS